MRLHLIAILALSTVLLADNVRISPRFRTVYVTTMANALDQYLASSLTSERVLWVVLEPASADAVFTESLDDAFWTWLAKTYPPAPGASSAKRTDPSGQNAQAGTHRGMVFLVDPRTRLVIWSAYKLPKNSSPDEMNHAATQITSQLKAAFGKK
jgi:hypothetical protein